MADTPQHSPESSLPFVERPTIDSFLDTAQQPDYLSHEWAELSSHNPHLRDFITIIASREAPEDQTERQRFINMGVMIAGVVERSLQTAHLESWLEQAGEDPIKVEDTLTALEQAAALDTAETTHEDPPKRKRRGFLRIGGMAAMLTLVHWPTRSDKSYEV